MHKSFNKLYRQLKQLILRDQTFHRHSSTYSHHHLLYPNWVINHPILSMFSDRNPEKTLNKIKFHPSQVYLLQDLIFFLNCHWSSLWFDFDSMSLVHALNIFTTPPPFSEEKKPCYSSWVSCVFETLNSGLWFQVSPQSYPLRFLISAQLTLLLANSVRFAQAPTKAPQNLSVKRFSVVFLLYVKKPTSWEITWMVLSSS